jgi:hypothetical protein
MDSSINLFLKHTDTSLFGAVKSVRNYQIYKIYKYSDKTYSSTTFSTRGSILPDKGSNPGRRGEKPAANRMSYGMAFRVWYGLDCNLPPETSFLAGISPGFHQSLLETTGTLHKCFRPYFQFTSHL